MDEPALVLIDWENRKAWLGDPTAKYLSDYCEKLELPVECNTLRWQPPNEHPVMKDGYYWLGKDAYQLVFWIGMSKSQVVSNLRRLAKNIKQLEIMHRVKFREFL